MVVEAMRDISRQNDPQQLVHAYGQRMQLMHRYDGFLALSRRDLVQPFVRITRNIAWESPVNPWKHRDRLPMLSGGLLSELIYGETPVIIDDLETTLRKDDPAFEYFQGMRSLQALPLFDNGRAQNMVVRMSRKRAWFSHETMPEHVWIANLFGRATSNLVMTDEVRRAYAVAERELNIVADIQRSLLPEKLPNIPTLELAAHYLTSARSGGDYYDFFPLSDGRWGILIADVSGHGTPAAVLMAVTHSIAHTQDEEPEPASRLLSFINRHLATRYTNGTGTFVTAFYGIYDPSDRTLTYSRAGHTRTDHPSHTAGRGILHRRDGADGRPDAACGKSDLASAGATIGWCPYVLVPRLAAETGRVSHPKAMGGSVETLS